MTTENSVSELGVIFRGSPLFLAVLGHSNFRGISTLNFGPFSTKLGGNVRAIKKIPRMTTDPVRARITEKRPFLRSAQKFFLAKNAFHPKKSPGISEETDIYFGKGYFLLCTTFFGGGQNMVSIKK